MNWYLLKYKRLHQQITILTCQCEFLRVDQSQQWEFDKCITDHPGDSDRNIFGHYQHWKLWKYASNYRGCLLHYGKGRINSNSQILCQKIFCPWLTLMPIHKMYTPEVVYSIWKVSDCIGIIKLILVSVMKWQIHDTFNLLLSTKISKNIFINIRFAIRRLNKYILYAKELSKGTQATQSGKWNEMYKWKDDMKYPGYKPEQYCAKGYFTVHCICMHERFASFPLGYQRVSARILKCYFSWKWDVQFLFSIVKS